MPSPLPNTNDEAAMAMAVALELMNSWAQAVTPFTEQFQSFDEYVNKYAETVIKIREAATKSVKRRTGLS